MWDYPLYTQRIALHCGLNLRIVVAEWNVSALVDLFDDTWSSSSSVVRRPLLGGTSPLHSMEGIPKSPRLAGGLIGDRIICVFTQMEHPSE